MKLAEQYFLCPCPLLHTTRRDRCWGHRVLCKNFRNHVLNVKRTKSSDRHLENSIEKKYEPLTRKHGRFRRFRTISSRGPCGTDHLTVGPYRRREFRVAGNNRFLTVVTSRGDPQKNFLLFTEEFEQYS